MKAEPRNPFKCGSLGSACASKSESRCSKATAAPGSPAENALISAAYVSPARAVRVRVRVACARAALSGCPGPIPSQVMNKHVVNFQSPTPSSPKTAVLRRLGVERWEFEVDVGVFITLVGSETRCPCQVGRRKTVQTCVGFDPFVHICREECRSRQLCCRASVASMRYDGMDSCAACGSSCSASWQVGERQQKRGGLLLA